MTRLYPVGHRALVRVHLNTHADFMAVLEAFILVFVDLIAFDWMKGNSMLESTVTNDLNENFAITGCRSHHQLLEINPRQTAISRAVALQPEHVPIVLNDVVSDHIKAVVSVPGLDLKGYTIVPNDIGFQQAKVTFNVDIITGQRTGAVPHRDKISLQFTIGALARCQKVSKQTTSIGGMIAALANRRSRLFRKAENFAPKAHRKRTFIVVLVGLPNAIALSRRSRTTSLR